MTQYSGKVIRKTPVTPTQASASGVWKLNEQAAAIRNNSWPIAGVPDPISRSVRLRSSASATLSKTFASAGNRRTFTFSSWVKIGQFSTNPYIFSSGGSSTPEFICSFSSANELNIGYYNGSSYTYRLLTSQVFRDPSAWYHIVVAWDTTQATAANRIKLYVNGVQVTAFSTASYPSLNYDAAYINTTSAQYIGSSGSSAYFDGYLTEINFIDGQALTPSSFGTTDAFTGAWIPMAYTGTYGTNGFYVDFRDNTSTTTLGLDYSGNANNWTANNISLTAGSTYDSMLDVPTPWVGYSTTTDTTAVTRGNYCILDPLDFVTAAPTNGNLTLTNGFARATMGIPSTGKWYWENTIGSSSNNSCGLSPASSSLSDANGSSGFYAYHLSGNKYTAGSASSYGASYTNGDVIGVAVDADAGTVTFYKNNVSQGVAFSGLSFATPWLPLARPITSATTNINFGQRPFVYTPPTGHKTLCTTNLPTPTILNGAQYFAATTYTGNATARSISNAVNGVSFQPDFGWIKTRSNSGSYWLSDSVRGVTKYMSSNGTTAENTLTDELTSFNSDGFSLGISVNSFTNYNTWTYVAWQWKAGGTPAVTNTNGSITSTVSANTTAGFSVVTFTGNNSTGTVGHGLGVAPSMIIQKPRDSTGSWAVYHASIGAGNAVWLNLTDASSSYPTVWNSTAPTSSVYSVGSYIGTSNYVAYCFAAVAGYSAFGSYTGNGSSDGPFVFCGFRPRWVMIKRTDSANDWWIVDTSRNPYNLTNSALYPNSSSAETSNGFYDDDILSNGFKIRATNAASNASGGTYIYAAFAENPFKYSNAR